jgi:hypothetical protein
VSPDGGSDEHFGDKLSVHGDVIAVGAVVNFYKGYSAGGLYRRLCLLALLCMY